MPRLYFRISNHSATDLIQELYDERDKLDRERDKVNASIIGVSEHIVDNCKFELGQKVTLAGDYNTKADYLFIYDLYVTRTGAVYAKLCKPLKSDGSMPKDTARKSLNKSYPVSRLRAL